jgi:hypothetical protein
MKKIKKILNFLKQVRELCNKKNILNEIYFLKNEFTLIFITHKKKFN